MTTTPKPDQLLLRFRPTDTQNGISRSTVKKLAEYLGFTGETQSKRVKSLRQMHVAVAKAHKAGDVGRGVNPEAIRGQFSVVLVRTVQELNGIPCIELEEAGTPRQQIMVSRSFGSTVTQFDDLAESVSNFATKAAEKLRDDGSVAASVCIYVRTNPFKEEEPQYQRSMIVPLGQPSDDTMALISAALKGLKKIYRSGYRYKKSGVLLMGLESKGTVQATLFDDTAKQAKSDNMMSVMDTINRKMGQGSMTIAASGISHRWAMRRDRMSQNYTTDWNDLPVAR